MADKTYKLIELVGTSADSFAATGIARPVARSPQTAAARTVGWRLIGPSPVLAESLFDPKVVEQQLAPNRHP